MRNSHSESSSLRSSIDNKQKFSGNENINNNNNTNELNRNNLNSTIDDSEEKYRLNYKIYMLQV